MIEIKINGLNIAGNVSIEVTDGSMFPVCVEMPREEFIKLLKITKKTPLSLANKLKLKVSFNRFWERYKKKSGKEDAFKAWCKISETDRQAVLERVDDFVIANPDVKFRPMPATFLNGRRWEDELPVDKKAKVKSWAQPNEWR